MPSDCDFRKSCTAISGDGVATGVDCHDVAPASSPLALFERVTETVDYVEILLLSLAFCFQHGAKLGIEHEQLPC